ncbi:hypothetical protein PI124_g5239 [Phytophthora idaei]|nr:hypothetical protein PI125_g5966 [Phytophthora idaei]KAG3137193.1 hypothetical protein PI126_g17491 [Phytophthora idaei]KAG3250098.1 hypothetical protein PI124_g5239 [Phytophthora idaei]
MKAAIREIVEKDVKPARIRNELVDSFTLSTGAVPALKQIQNFVYNYRRSTMKNTDVVEDMEEIAAGSQLSDDLPDTTPFTCGYPLNEDGTPELGDGSDDDSLVIGITTQFLLKGAAWDPDVFVFHMDATFKLATCAYPVIVVVGRPFLVLYCMGDAEDAQINGVEQTLTAPCASAPSKPELHYLMCFFHVVENVKKRVSSLSNNSKYLVYRRIYEIHYARDATEFATIQERADALWRAVPELRRFADYFQQTWIKSRFCKW